MLFVAKLKLSFIAINTFPIEFTICLGSSLYLCVILYLLISHLTHFAFYSEALF